MILKIRKEEIVIEYGYQVRQDDNLALILFEIIIQLVEENIIKVLEKVNINILRIRSSRDSSAVLKLCEMKVVKMVKENISILICIDDGTMIFNKRMLKLEIMQYAR